MLFNASADVAKSPVTVVGYGVWGGVFFTVTGVFGVVAGQQRTSSAIVTFLVLSVLAAALFATTMLSLASVGIDIVQDQEHHEDDDDYAGTFATAVDSLLVTVSLLEGVVAVWSSAICCRTVFSGRRLQSGFLPPLSDSSDGSLVLA
ncbi:hypothetical protein NP493_26g06004 [Ridgeia piscesae]|uniref:Uncharacterized protein n=1 Tax=Ridgeia piscesae TaxID=27915 RepID=A0AAD9PDL8_RIDPI|nr:hypothetical protein NP493_26g06004 [Ridgeia piscesae]